MTFSNWIYDVFNGIYGETQKSGFFSLNKYLLKLYFMMLLSRIVCDLNQKTYVKCISEAHIVTTSIDLWLWKKDKYEVNMQINKITNCENY